MNAWRRRSNRSDTAAQPSAPVPQPSAPEPARPEPAETMPEPSPVTVDAADLEAVLRRAVQLASDRSMTPEPFPVGSLEQVAAELHLPVAALADAIAEYRAGAIERPPGADGAKTGRRGQNRRGIVDRLVGPRSVVVRHRSGLSDDEVLDNLTEWLTRHHRLRIRVTPDGTVVGVRRRGAMASVDVAMRSVAGAAGLAKMREVRGAAVPVEPGHTSICVVADLTDQRSECLIGGSAVAVGGAAVVSTVAVVTVPVVFVGVPVFVGAGWLLSRLTHRSNLRKAQEEVEFTADHVAAGAGPSSKLDSLGNLGRGKDKAKRLLKRSQPEDT